MVRRTAASPPSSARTCSPSTTTRSGTRSWKGLRSCDFVLASPSSTPRRQDAPSYAKNRLASLGASWRLGVPVGRAYGRSRKGGASMTTIAELLRQRIVVLDGGMGTMLQQAKLTAADYGGAQHHGCPEALVLHAPD